MYYFQYEEKQIYKWEVSFDVQKVRALRDQIVDECSQITHVEGAREDYLFPYTCNYALKNKGEIRNCSQDKNHGHWPGPPHTYLVFPTSYDQYMYPKLVLLIDRLLQGDTSVLQEGIEQIEEPHAANVMTEKQKKLNQYYIQLQALINLKLVGSIPTEAVSQVASFFQQSQLSEVFPFEKVNSQKIKEK